jgi:hypothetical protein
MLDWICTYQIDGGQQITIEVRAVNAGIAQAAAKEYVAELLRTEQIVGTPVFVKIEKKNG